MKPRKSSARTFAIARRIAEGFEDGYWMGDMPEGDVSGVARDMAWDIVEEMSPEEQLDAWYVHQAVHQPDDIAIEFNLLEPSDPSIARDLLIDQYWNLAFSIGMHLSKKANEKGGE